MRVLAHPGFGRLLLSLALLSLAMPSSVCRNVIAGTIGPAAVRAHPDLVHATYLATHRPGYATTASSHLREMPGGADAQPPRYLLSHADLQRIAQQVLVLSGEDDTIEPIEDAKARSALMPHSRLGVASFPARIHSNLSHPS